LSDTLVAEGDIIQLLDCKSSRATPWLTKKGEPL
jgi:hypothetical protein